MNGNSLVSVAHAPTADRVPHVPAAVADVTCEVRAQVLDALLRFGHRALPYLRRIWRAEDRQRREQVVAKVASSSHGHPDEARNAESNASPVDGEAADDPPGTPRPARIGARQ